MNYSSSVITLVRLSLLLHDGQAKLYGPWFHLYTSLAATAVVQEQQSPRILLGLMCHLVWSVLRWCCYSSLSTTAWPALHAKYF